MAGGNRLIGRTIGLLLFLWAFSMFSLMVGSAEPAETTSTAKPAGYLQYQEPPKSGTSTWGTVAYVITLVIMFIGILVFAYITSRFVASRAGRLGQSGGSQIHMTLPLAPNRNLHLVEMAGKFFVIGVTEQSIQLLFHFESAEEVKPYLLSKPSGAASFEDTFARQLNALKDLRGSFPQVFSSGDKKDDHSEKR